MGAFAIAMAILELAERGFSLADKFIKNGKQNKVFTTEEEAKLDAKANQIRHSPASDPELNK